VASPLEYKQPHKQGGHNQKSDGVDATHNTAAIDGAGVIASIPSDASVAPAAVLKGETGATGAASDLLPDGADLPALKLSKRPGR
jgi:hypothetical protein